MSDVLMMEKIVKKFGQGHTEVTALKKVDFNVAQGEFVSVIGPSGSGKSTFLTIAGGLQTPTEGKITINGADFSQMNEKQRSKARFKEQFQLVEKIEKEKNAAKIEELLKSLDIWELREQYPKALSGGERQRVAIARSLFNDPQLILADEPTASLDSDHAYDVVKLLAKETHERNKAIVMVTHDERMTQWSDNVYQMKDGELLLKQ